MMSDRSETITFSRDDLERIVRHIGQSQMSKSMFLGKFGAQTVRWASDGSVEVTTSYQQGEFEELPPAVENPTPVKRLSKRKK